MKFSRLVLDDGTVVAGEFALVNVNEPGYRVMMFAGRASEQTSSLARPPAVTMDGKIVALPVGNVVWAEAVETPRVVAQLEKPPASPARPPREPQAAANQRTPTPDQREALRTRIGELAVTHPAKYERLVEAAGRAKYPMRNPGAIALTLLTADQVAGIEEILAKLLAPASEQAAS